MEELANGAETNSEKFQLVMSAMKDSIAGDNSVTAATQDLVDTLGTHFTAITTTVTDNEANITTTMQTEGDKQKEVVQTTADDITDIAKEGVTSAANAVSDNAAEVTTATQTAAQDAVKGAESVLKISGNTSATFKSMGSTTMKSFAEGVRAEGSTVRSAFETVLQTAINNMDVSGLVAQINRRLGSALNS